MINSQGLRFCCRFVAVSVALLSSNNLLAQKTLKSAYRDFFPVGVAVAPRNLTGPEAELIIAQFSSLTPENAMKMGPIHPEPDRYAWQDPDAIIAFAQNNGMKVRGHTLCWHNQTPRWFFTDSTGRQVSREVLLGRLKRHISEVVGRYKGKIYAWDVVNEAVPDTGISIYRRSKFYEIIGEDYIEKAFEYAHAADPDAKLFYNDYNTENTAKREKIYQLVKKLKDKGVPVDGVGLQGHWSIYEPTAQELEKSISQFASLGVAVQITELDISVHPKEHVRRAKKPADTGELTAEMIAKQAAQYKMLFDVFRKYKGVVTGVTFWNVSDKSSWLDNFPVPGRKDYPLLFDENYKPKKAFEGVVNF
ncbi:Endo-1,4-beta-xylanase B [Dyadobacter sp. CECT 9275]|uniref:Beta-xylanase n=1 Tax=Dyadobacter helix TaxID=2822344 RepID=A0A916JCF2_9BACT|nr:endo-1,4-beta-xylanase [Dyadobacter sp. CECT 9275]CAG5001145.1 Endo-1,4-beta-xylanase B [Dyadobacter sp. CECT 9275]